jgi:hypothetical protein
MEDMLGNVSNVGERVEFTRKSRCDLLGTESESEDDGFESGRILVHIK